MPSILMMSGGSNPNVIYQGNWESQSVVWELQIIQWQVWGSF